MNNNTPSVANPTEIATHVGLCYECGKKFYDGWNDFFCCRHHAMQYRIRVENGHQ